MKKVRFYSGSGFDCQLTIEITERDLFKRLSIYGVILESGKEISFGQIHEEVKDIIPARLYKIWKRWHLNDMRAGTFMQEEILRQAKDKGIKISSYDDACNYLQKFNAYNDSGYKYGHAWLKEELPQHIVDYLCSI